MKYKLRKLKNGIRVILVPHNDTSAVTLLALYEVGSRYENEKNNGASHFIEHMMFKGTKLRPTTLDISRDLDSVGADYNAYTSKDYTGYYIKLQSAKIGLSVDMLSDMLYKSKFSAKEINSERQVILEELRMYEDNPIMLVDELVEEELFRGSPLGMRIGGTIESVSALSRSDLISYRDKYYVPSRTVLAVAGKFDEAEVMNLLQNSFGKTIAKAKPVAYKKFNPSTAGFRQPRIRIVKRDTEQIQTAISWPTFGYGDERLPALKVLSTILGGTMSSRLFTSVREQSGLCYFIRSRPNSYQDTGNLTIQAGLASNRVDEASQMIMAEVAKLKKSKVKNHELKLAKEYIKGKTMLALEDSSNQADFYARQALMAKKIVSAEDRIKAIMSVSADQIQAIAKQVFTRNRTSMAIIGPLDPNHHFDQAIKKL